MRVTGGIMTMPFAGWPEAVRVLAPGPAGAICRAARRVLAVAALALAALLVFVLLPGRNVPGVTTGPYLLPPVPTVRSWHPHGPNRPAIPADAAGPARNMTHAER
jgi:hypothetical protein